MEGKNAKVTKDGGGENMKGGGLVRQENGKEGARSMDEDDARGVRKRLKNLENESEI